MFLCDSLVLHCENLSFRHQFWSQLSYVTFAHFVTPIFSTTLVISCHIYIRPTAENSKHVHIFVFTENLNSISPLMLVGPLNRGSFVNFVSPGAPPPPTMPLGIPATVTKQMLIFIYDLIYVPLFDRTGTMRFLPATW